MTVRLIVRPGDYRRILAGPLRRLGDMRPALRRSVAERRAVIAEEFERQAGYTPGGGSVSWPKTKPFGSEPATQTTLQRTGSLLRAYMGRGRGSIERYSANAAVFGVDGSVFPQAQILRRGGRIRVTDRMRGFLSAVKGVHLKRSKRFIRIPARPHAAANPKARERIKTVLRRYVATGRER